eukprot:1189429-Pyramimonas_sp.AAC.1
MPMGEPFRSVDFNKNTLWMMPLRILLRRISVAMLMCRVSIGILMWRVSLGILHVGGFNRDRSCKGFQSESVCGGSH